jgi:hypothetical protein
MPGISQMGLFGPSTPLRWFGRARSGRAKVFVINDSAPDPDSFYSGSIVRSGDFIDVERLSEPGNYPAVMAANGLAIIHAHGDLTRQLLHAESYVRRLLMWTGDSGQYINNRPPVGTLSTLELILNVTPPQFDALSRFSDANGDILTIKSITGDIPPGMQFNGQFLVGTPSELSAGTFFITVADPPGDFALSQVDWTITTAPIVIDAGALTESVRVKTNVGGALVNTY